MDDWLCRQQGLPTPAAAQRMKVVEIPAFLSEKDIADVLEAVASVQAAKAAGVLERGANEAPAAGGR